MLVLRFTIISLSSQAATINNTAYDVDGFYAHKDSCFAICKAAFKGNQERIW